LSLRDVAQGVLTEHLSHELDVGVYICWKGVTRYNNRSGKVFPSAPFPDAVIQADGFAIMWAKRAESLALPSAMRSLLW
jgi:hypothetical protein